MTAVMEQDLTTATRATHYLPAAEVSPGELRGLLALCRTHDRVWQTSGQKLASSADLATRTRLDGPVVARWVQIDPRERRQQIPFLHAFVMNGADAAQAARTHGFVSDAQVRKVQRWAADFLLFAADFLNLLEAEWARLEEATRQSWAERRRLKDDLDAYCQLTHGEAGGSGRTPAIGRSEHMAKGCPACAVRAALFGPAGWADAPDEDDGLDVLQRRKIRRRINRGKGKAQWR